MVTPTSSRDVMREELKVRLLDAARAVGGAHPEFVAFPRARARELCADRLVELLGAGSGTVVEELPLEPFLEALPGDTRQVSRLRRVVRANLIDVRVYRVNDSAAYVVGQAPMGGVAGLVLATEPVVRAA